MIRVDKEVYGTVGIAITLLCKPRLWGFGRSKAKLTFNEVN